MLAVVDRLNAYIYKAYTAQHNVVLTAEAFTLLFHAYNVKSLKTLCFKDMNPMKKCLVYLIASYGKLGFNHIYLFVVSHPF